MTGIVVVCGGRDFLDYGHVEQVLTRHHRRTPITALYHGGGRGADTIAGVWAQRHRIPTRIFPAQWNTHGKQAGILRTIEMLASAPIACVIAFPGGRGTAFTIARARMLGIVVIEAPPHGE